jgi:hypothetical protein
MGDIAEIFDANPPFAFSKFPTTSSISNDSGTIIHSKWLFSTSSFSFHSHSRMGGHISLCDSSATLESTHLVSVSAFSWTPLQSCSVVPTPVSRHVLLVEHHPSTIRGQELLDITIGNAQKTRLTDRHFEDGFCRKGTKV